MEVRFAPRHRHHLLTFSQNLSSDGLRPRNRHLNPRGLTRVQWVRNRSAVHDISMSASLTAMQAFMLHISGHISLTNWALQKTGTLHGMVFKNVPRIARLTIYLAIQADFWDGFEGGFLNHIEQVEQGLIAAGLPSLGKSNAREHDSPSKVL